MHRLQLFFAQIDVSGLPNQSKGDVAQNDIKIVLSILFGVLGAIALLIITIAGFRYVIAKGDPQDVAQARNTIIYALVGLLVSLMAFSVVTFVLKGVG